MDSGQSCHAREVFSTAGCCEMPQSTIRKNYFLNVFLVLCHRLRLSTLVRELSAPSLHLLRLRVLVGLPNMDRVAPDCKRRAN